MVIIDDLDRCEAKAAYQLLEGIKIYLNLRNCVFVLGMNSKVIEVAIAEHLSKIEGVDSARRSREYFDKLCQTVLHLPALRDVSAFLGHCLTDMPGAAAICQVVQEESCLPTNARKVKAFSNLLLRYAPRFRDKLEAGDRTCAERVLIFACLYHFHPDIYRLIEAHPKFFHELRSWCLKPESASGHEVFKGLRAPWKSPITDEAEARPPSLPDLTSTFSDPNEGDVLRIQALIIRHETVPTSEVTTYLVE